MEKLFENTFPLLLNWKDQPQNTHFSYPYKTTNSSFHTVGQKLEVPTLLQQPEHQIDSFSFDIWTILLCVFILHVCRQFYYYYRFFSSEAMQPLWKYLSFTKHILPSFLISVISGIRSINYDFLAKDISANAGLKKIHMMPCRSTFHTYHTDVQGYKGTTFVIAMNTDEKIIAFRRVLMRFISERLSSGLLQQAISEGVEKWIQKGSVDMLDITMLLESLVMRFLYDVDPDEVFTPEQRKQRAQDIYNGTKWVLYDSYRPIANVFFLLYQATGIDFDPVRRIAIRTITEIWDDCYDRQMEMIKNGKHCLLGAFLADPILANQDLGFIKANTIGAIMGGQFLTSISNITGILHSLSKGDLPHIGHKRHWILQIITDWSPLINILRSYLGFVVIIPSTGNSQDLNRSFSLGPRQCPGKGLVLEAYGFIVDLLVKHKFSIECLENTNIRASLWPFANQQLRFRIN